MKISGGTLYTAVFISIAHCCPSCTGVLSTSVKLVLARKRFSSFYLGKKKQYYNGVRALLHHLVGRLDFSTAVENIEHSLITWGLAPAWTNHPE